MHSTRLLAAAALAVSLPATAQAHTPTHPRPDLSAAAGTAKLANGAVSGTATIKDSGAGAATSTAALVAKNLTTNKKTTIRSFAIPRLHAGAKRKLTLSKVKVAGLGAGTYAIQICADRSGRLKERSEANNCATVGRLTVAASPESGPAAPTPAGTATPAPSSAPAPAPAPAQKPPAPAGPRFSPPPQHPIAPLTYDDDATEVNGDDEAADGTYADGAVSHGHSPDSDYWFAVPSSYDHTDATPERLLVWLHGCGGDAEGDAFEASPDLTGEADRPYITLSLGGTDGGCWDPVDQHEDWVLAAVNDIEKHLNIDRRRVIIGGYSSGGDLGYRTLFDHADWFAGGLFENTSPFSQNGASDDHAAWKFPVDHLAHNQDSVYDLKTDVQPAIDKLNGDGFAAFLLKRDGGHSDDEGYDGQNPDCATKTGNCQFVGDPDRSSVGTDHDLRHVLLPLLLTATQPGGAAGWQAPVSAATTAGE